MTYTKRVDNYCRGLEHVSAGTASKCSECQRLWNMSEEKLSQLIDRGDALDEGGFSWRQCDTCGSSYGGNRYDGHGFDKAGKVVHLSMCEDCLIYFSNGDIPVGGT